MTRRELVFGLAAAGAGAPVVARAARPQPSPGAARGPLSPAGSLTDVTGLRVGHFTDRRRPTGCTVILFDRPATAGADYGPSAPGETLGVMLQPVSPVDRIHGILLTGGGPMGLAAVPGVVEFLEQKGIGYDWGVRDVRVPIVIGAVIDDLALGDGRIRPDASAARAACEAASTGPVAEGSIGAGAGATVGKMLRSRGMGGMKGGIGTVSIRLGNIVVAALTVVNAAGDIVDWRTGRIVAGARRADGAGFADTMSVMKNDLARRQAVVLDDPPFRSTTLSIVATNAAFDKTQMTRIAMMANTGAARAISPYHTTGDGDQVIAVSTGQVDAGAPLTAIGAIAAEAVADAIVRAVRQASGVEGWPSVADL